MIYYKVLSKANRNNELDLLLVLTLLQKLKANVSVKITLNKWYKYK
jgi:hypothetical protein